MDRTTVFTKTAKGITQVNQKSASLSKDLMKVLKLIDGKSNFGQLMEKAEVDKNALEKALNSLTKDGFARVFQVRQEEKDPFAEEDDFDFTAPGKMPVSTQRVVAGAANDISELVRQQEKTDTEKRSREQAHEQARVRAKAEAESRAKLEAEARAKAQAEQAAMEQARRAKEAADRAKAELDTKMREEEARRRSLAEQQARLTVEQKAKEEAESKRLVELRMKAEKEARALAEARARAEAEAQALAKARAEAEAAAKKQAQEATSAEKQLKERLKEEIESRIRGEMEDLLRNEVEEKTRNEMRAEILAEARLAAKAELEERLREEREALANAEREARSKAETEARARAEQEARLRAQAEARAAAESEARIKAEEEARRLRESEARTREEADARVEVERRAKYEAEARAKVDAEERARRESELQATLEQERKAKQEAELRAKVEARARETIAEDTRVKVQAELEGNLEKRAEIEGKAQAKAYMVAKARAEQEEDERLRAEQARKAREIAEILRTKVEPDEVAPETPAQRRSPRRRRGSLLKTAVVSLFVLLILVIGALHVIPLRPYAAKLERTMAAWLHDDVSIGAVTFRLFPTPHLNVENVSVGKLLDAKAMTGQIYLDIATLFGERPSISRLELSNVTLTPEAVRRIPTWGKPEGKSQAGEITRIELRNVKLEVKPALEPFEATLVFQRDGSLRQANLRGAGGSWSLVARPGDKGFDFDFNTTNWTVPVGVAFPVADATLKGTFDATQIVVPEFEAHALEGVVNGTLRVTWPSSFRLESDLSIAHLDSKQLMHAFTPDIAVTGKLDGNFNLVAESPNLETLLTAPRVQGRFKLSEGSVSNVDLVAVMQSDAAGQRAGVTKFAELTGEYAAGDRRASYRQLSLQGGVLRGNGVVDLGATGALTGHLALEIRSQVAQDRGSFVVSGTVARPIIKRGG